MKEIIYEENTNDNTEEGTEENTEEDIRENSEEHIEENNSDQNTRESDSNFSAKKSLGQNFLHSPQAISAMVFATDIKKGDVILEIGPGKGALTVKLLESGAKVIAFEKDDRAIPFLHEKFPDEIKKGDLTIVHEDILKLDIENNPYFKASKYKISANIPYYITGELLRKFLESNNQPEKMVLMLQKEVARRIVGEESKKTDKNGVKIKKESILSISVKAYGTPKYITTVSRKFFRPVPNVDSAILAINNISKDFFYEKDMKIDENKFFEVVKAGFAHKRKIVVKNLEEIIDKETLKRVWIELKIDTNVRAEELSLSDWKNIALNTNCFPQKSL